jgi:hypothetical protein
VADKQEKAERISKMKSLMQQAEAATDAGEKRRLLKEIKALQ